MKVKQLQLRVVPCKGEEIQAMQEENNNYDFVIRRQREAFERSCRSVV